MPMPMVLIRKMRMTVDQGRMAMAMRVRFVGCDIRPMCMLMVFVVNMRVFMLQFLVFVLMVMAFNDMKIKANAHQGRCSDHLPGDGLGEQNHAEHRTEKRRCGEVSAGSCSSYVP